MIIGISGKAESGKDTVAAIIQYLLSPTLRENYDLEEFLKNYEMYTWDCEWETRAFADKVKRIAAILLGKQYEDVDTREFKNSTLGIEWDYMTGREFLVKLGTDAIRDHVHKDAWVNSLMSHYKPDREDPEQLPPNWIITDVRFINEALACTNTYFNAPVDRWLLRIERPGYENTGNSRSEIELDNWNFDYKIINDGSLTDLMNKVKAFLISINLISS